MGRPCCTPATGSRRHDVCSVSSCSSARTALRALHATRPAPAAHQLHFCSKPLIAQSPSLGAHSPSLQGSYGTVRACTHEPSGQAYAVKVLSKRKGGSEERSEIIMREVRGCSDAGSGCGSCSSCLPACFLPALPLTLLLLLPRLQPPNCPTPQVRLWRMLSGSPHVAELVGCYQDDNNIYIVQELLTGGDLQGLLDAQVCATVPGFLFAASWTLHEPQAFLHACT